ncbi:fish-egg lectin-like [Megalobrama amblycephala]|uniref:fish-egg lectin-like n=1 Tax=Megalobrama amblycephala TaxID=75352 RepID=UPI0020140E07|nr:fish-egg lectin-like [Megalobrama amblycephala]XP_048013042.1 fish-egg lectin-like [Megalobrama amblycephala]
MKACQCILLLFSCQFLYTLALECEVIPGTLKQIDAGLGLVGGVNNDNEVFLFLGNSFVRISGSLKHFTVGPAGEFGVSPSNVLFKFQSGSFRQIQGSFKQVDAGSEIVAGVNPIDDVSCINRDTNNNGPPANLVWTQLTGRLKYYSCGPYSCWGVNFTENVFLKRNVTGSACGGSSFSEIINGTLSMVEVATDGSVYGVNSQGSLLQRFGVSPSNPAGTGWQGIVVCPNGHKHVTYDLGRLWVICSDGSIRSCT